MKKKTTQVNQIFNYTSPARGELCDGIPNFYKLKSANKNVLYTTTTTSTTTQRQQQQQQKTIPKRRSPLFKRARQRPRVCKGNHKKKHYTDKQTEERERENVSRILKSNRARAANIF